MSVTLEARVFQKTDTLANWMANPLILGKGEQAFVASSVDGVAVIFKIGDGSKKFSDLPWPDFTVKDKIAPGAFTGKPTGIYVPTADGSYGSVSVALADGYQVIYWDGTTAIKIVYPISLSGYATKNDIKLSGAHADASNSFIVNSLIPEATSTNTLTPTIVSGSYVSTSGVITANAALDRTANITIDPTKIYFFSLKIFGGATVALVSYWDASNNFISYQLTGPGGTTTTTITNYVITPPLNATSFIISTDHGNIGTLSIKTSAAYEKGAKKTDVDLNSAALAQMKGNIVVSNYVTVAGYVNKNTGAIVVDSNYKRTDYLLLSAFASLLFTTTMTGGNSVAVTSFFDANKTFIGYGIGGTTSSTINYVDQDITSGMPGGAVYAIISFNATYSLTLKYTGWPPYVNLANYINTYTAVESWGDSLTAAGQYQIGINSVLGVPVNNFGLSSDFAHHIANRFVSYYSDAVPYKGTASYAVPDITVRQATLSTSFFVLFMGTNELLNFNRAAGTFTTGSSAWNALQPNPNFKFDRLYAKSYRDSILKNIRKMTALLPKGNFVIITGHAGSQVANNTASYLAMEAIDQEILRQYPNNYISLRLLYQTQYDYMGIRVNADFVKPAISGSVAITLSDATWIGDSNKNSDSKICIGAKDFFDTYQVTSVAGSVATCTLLTTGTEFVTGETISKEYILVSDLGRDAITIPTAVFSNSDIISYTNKSYPRSTMIDDIHFTNTGYQLMGTIIGKEILSRTRAGKF